MGREAPWTGPCWAVVLGRPRGLRRGAARRGGGAGGSHRGGGGKGGQLGGLERGAWGPLRLSRPRKASAEPCCPHVGEGSPLHAALLPETLGAASPSAGWSPRPRRSAPTSLRLHGHLTTSSPRTPGVCQPVSEHRSRPLSEAVSSSIKRGCRCTPLDSERDEDKGTSRHQNVPGPVCQIRAMMPHLHNEPVGSRQLKSTRCPELGPEATAPPSPAQVVCEAARGGPSGCEGGLSTSQGEEMSFDCVQFFLIQFLVRSPWAATLLQTAPPGRARGLGAGTPASGSLCSVFGNRTSPHCPGRLSHARAMDARDEGG